MPIQTQVVNPDPSILPVERTAEPATQFGENNEHVPERSQEALRWLVHQFSAESESTRRQEIRRIKQAHQFWRLPYG
jgi:hypothetical protein